MADNALLKRIYDHYVTQGLTPHAAAAMASQVMAESGGNPNARETLANGAPGPGRGAMQWTTPSRQAGFEKFKAERPWLDPNALETQLDYSLHETDTTEKAAGNKLYTAPDYTTAVNAATAYTRPAGYTPDNPAGAHNYAGRYNVGASLVGAQPIMGPAIAAAGGSQTAPEVPSGGLLSPAGQYAAGATGSLPTTPAALAADDAASAKAATAAANAEMSAYASAGKQAGALGQSLLAAGTAKAPAPMQLQESVNQPQQMAAMPDFTQQLAQSRLLRKPWEQGGF